MKRLFFLALALAVAPGIARAAPVKPHVATITFVDCTHKTAAACAALPSWTTAAIVQAFTLPVGKLTSGTAGITPAGLALGASQVVGDSTKTMITANAFPFTGNYLAIGTGTSYTFNFTKPVQYLAFLIGMTKANSDSIKMTYTTGASNVDLLKTANLLADPKVDQGMIMIDRGGLVGITSITFSSGNPFAIDQIAAATPEPASWALMILGFGVVGGQLRKRRGSHTLPAAA